MDDVDAAILRELQLDARLTNRQLAARVGVAPSTCSLRLRALEQRGVLKGYHADVDLDRVGLGVQAVIAFQIRPLSREAIASFKAFALKQPEVLAVFVLGGGDDFLVHVAVPSVPDVHALLVDRFSGRREVVSFRTSIVFEQTQRRAVQPR
ncbi:Lrp/AsnC family transcriptional regulator [Streptomyces sp. NP160]|uniref:Lrp/AsnC family transcriptional regulator n=1 Tax=Streptomyces sp. NP160 TaxID=2586637 RepID=UPI00111896DE|nr:Lrp/AsnC family transcriptional regulator [Streptomyces sp. NP160]TNM59813.1 Lrp/AsnC family transcriptional regulator [Streptomyces sp. NP160]